MKFFIVGEEGNIGKTLLSKLDSDLVTKEITEANVIALCVNSEVAKQYVNLSKEKIYLNFSSHKFQEPNVINGIGCSTLSVLLPLLCIKNTFQYVTGPINVVTLFPQNALSSRSKFKGTKSNVPVYTLAHQHQYQIEKIIGTEINMSHFVTPADKYLTSNIFITFNKKINLFNKIIGCDAKTRDYKTWNIISKIDNVEEPINFMLKLLEQKNIGENNNE